MVFVSIFPRANLPVNQALCVTQAPSLSGTFMNQNLLIEIE